MKTILPYSNRKNSIEIYSITGILPPERIKTDNQIKDVVAFITLVYNNLLADDQFIYVDRNSITQAQKRKIYDDNKIMIFARGNSVGEIVYQIAVLREDVDILISSEELKTIVTAVFIDIKNKLFN